MDSVRVILQAANENNFELAQRTVDSEVRKNPSSDVYLSLKVFVASKRNDSKQALETAERAVPVCSKKTLEMFLIPVLVQFNAPHLLSAAFVRVNRLDPSNHDVCEAWLETSLLMGDLGSAQKASMAMQRTTKKQRSVCYQACFIMALDNSNSKLFPALAERMLQKYLPAKTPQECYVVALVHKMTSLEKMVKYLQEPETFKAFVSGSLDLQILLLDGLKDTKEWSQLYEYATNQLKRIDSYNYWEALNLAAVELGKPEATAELASQFTSSNSLLSRVDLATKTGNTKDLHAAISQYWHSMGSKPSTFKLLKFVINKDTIGLVEPRNNTMGEKINYAKFRSFIEDPLDTSELVQIHEDHISEVPAEKTDYFIGTDALIMVAQSILRGRKEFSRELAATVLEHSLIADPHNFYARLLLIQIYQSLGVLNVACKHFDSLSIRNIQFETLGYLMSTRIGSVSPDLSKLVLAKLKMAIDRTPNFGVYSVASLTDNSFTQFDGIFKLGQKLRLSLDRCLVTLEQMHAARCTRGSVDFSDLHCIPNPTSILMDNRDFDIASFDDGRESVVENLFMGPRQGTEYVRIQKLKEMAFQSVVQKTDTPSLAGLSSSAMSCPELTEIEKWNVQCVEAIVKDAKNASLKAPPAFDTTQALDWELFHWCYTVLETTRLAKSVKCNVAFNPASTIREWVSGYQNQLNAWEPKVNAAFRESGLPGEASKVVRAIKQEHMKKLKNLLEIVN